MEIDPASILGGLDKLKAQWETLSPNELIKAQMKLQQTMGDVSNALLKKTQADEKKK